MAVQYTSVFGQKLWKPGLIATKKIPFCSLIEMLLNSEEFLRSAFLHKLEYVPVRFFESIFEMFDSYNPDPNQTKSLEEAIFLREVCDCYLGRSQELIKLTQLIRLLAKGRSIKCRAYQPKAY